MQPAGGMWSVDWVFCAGLGDLVYGQHHSEPLETQSQMSIECIAATYFSVLNFHTTSFYIPFFGGGVVFQSSLLLQMCWMQYNYCGNSHSY